MSHTNSSTPDRQTTPRAGAREAFDFRVYEKFVVPNPRRERQAVNHNKPPPDAEDAKDCFRPSPSGQVWVWTLRTWNLGNHPIDRHTIQPS